MDRRLSAVSAVALLRLSVASANDNDVPADQPADTGTSVTATMGTSQNLDEIVVNGIRRGDLILPTTVSSTSAYGLDLGVMDTPRNNTLLSKAQLDALNVHNPSGFSYLTSSSYSDASFGEPNIPRIRGQYADLFFNGMRDSFTLNGYGAPISFNSFDSIDIVKGPASVQGGPGSGVGGAINVATKMPNLEKAFAEAELEFDSQQKRRGSFDVGMPFGGGDWGVRLSFSDDGNGSYYTDMFLHQQSLFLSLLGQITPQYSVLITGGVENTTYREDDGINRVNQQLIDDGIYLTGGVPGGLANAFGFGSEVDLTGTTGLSRHTIINENIGDSAHSLHIKGQIIQTFKVSDNFSIVNNTFYDYMNRYNEVQDYYADSCIACFTIENKTDFKVKFPIGSIANDIDAGLTYRYAHVLSIQNFVDEPVSIFDLSGDPSTFAFPHTNLIGDGGFLYQAAFGHVQYGLPGRFQGPPGGFSVPGFLNGTADSNLRDAAVFLEHRMQFTPQWSALYGIRGDLVNLSYSDPLGGADYGAPAGLSTLPLSVTTSWYGLYNGNVSLVFQPVQNLSLYLTYNKAQYVLSTTNDGGLSTWGEDPTDQLRQSTLLEEGGVKLDLFDKRLFISTAGFHQERAITTGVGGISHSEAHITGGEFELNYQPDPHFFATASYSYLHTTLDTPAGFYNFPAELGTNFDGAAVGPTQLFASGQSFQDPGVPQQLINVLANYKHESGWGAQATIQVTSPISVTQSGFLNLAGLAASFPGVSANQLAEFTANGGYYKAPIIHWQYTANAAVFYSFLDHYSIKFSVYNLANKRNLTNDVPFYGNDFITVQPPRDYDLTINAKF